MILRPIQPSEHCSHIFIAAARHEYWCASRRNWTCFAGGSCGCKYLRNLVGLPGFEPGTSCTPSKRASQAAPQPETPSVAHVLILARLQAHVGGNAGRPGCGINSTRGKSSLSLNNFTCFPLFPTKQPNGCGSRPTTSTGIVTGCGTGLSWPETLYRFRSHGVRLPDCHCQTAQAIGNVLDSARRQCYPRLALLST